MNLQKPCRTGLLVLCLLAHPLLEARQQKQAAPAQNHINEAIRKGADYLIKKYPQEIPTNIAEFELVVYTLIHAELDPNKMPSLKKGIQDLLTFRVNTTYQIAVRCLALHSLLVQIKGNSKFGHLRDKMTAIQKQIAESAQFLVDIQLDNGQWTYGGEAKNAPVSSSLITGAPPQLTELNKTASKIAWENASGLTGTLYKLVPKYGADPDKKTDLGKPVKPGAQAGDNSNTHYALLGLIAAEMSGVEAPRTTWELALKWFETSQNSDGGYGYIWGKGAPPKQTHSYGSMTTAGAIALAAAAKYSGKDFKKDPRFQGALKWLGQNFSVSENPKHSEDPQFKAVHLRYFLYGLERIGAFTGEKMLGPHDWYAEGAAYLLKTQKDDGSWPSLFGETDVIATSFAVLFLKRATESLIDTGRKDPEDKNKPINSAPVKDKDKK